MDKQRREEVQLILKFYARELEPQHSFSEKLWQLINTNDLDSVPSFEPPSANFEISLDGAPAIPFIGHFREDAAGGFTVALATIIANRDWDALLNYEAAEHMGRGADGRDVLLDGYGTISILPQNALGQSI